MGQPIRQSKQSLTRKRPKSDAKVNKALKSYRELSARVKLEGETVWLKNALEINATKLRRYGMLHIATAKTKA